MMTISITRVDTHKSEEKMLSNKGEKYIFYICRFLLSFSYIEIDNSIHFVRRKIRVKEILESDVGFDFGESVFCDECLLRNVLSEISYVLHHELEVRDFFFIFFFETTLFSSDSCDFILDKCADLRVLLVVFVSN